MCATKHAQEAVAPIDNPTPWQRLPANRPLKSLSDMLKGSRAFRQDLLGKGRLLWAFGVFWWGDAPVRPAKNGLGAIKPL